MQMLGMVGQGWACLVEGLLPILSLHSKYKVNELWSIMMGWPTLHG